MSKVHHREEVTPTQRMLNTWAVVIILWAFFRNYYKESLPIWVDECIAKPAIFLTPVLYYIQRFEIDPALLLEKAQLSTVQNAKRLFQALGISFRTLRFDLILSFFVGAIFMGIGAYASYKRYGTVFFIHGRYLQEYNAIALVILALLAATWEELLSRGFVLKRLLEEKMNKVQAIAFCSFLYFFMHIPIVFTSAEITSWTILQVLGMDILFSVMVSTLFLYKRSTVLAILVHFFYTLSLFFFL